MRGAGSYYCPVTDDQLIPTSPSDGGNKSRLRFLRSLQTQLPYELYLAALHVAATEGVLPVYDAKSHKRIPKHPNEGQLETDERIKLLQYMVNKGIPNARAIPVASENDDDVPDARDVLDVKTREQLSRSELAALVLSEDEEEEA